MIPDFSRKSKIHQANAPLPLIQQIPKEIRDIIDNCTSLLQMTCKKFWEERAVNPSWLIHKNDSKQLKKIVITNAPISLKLPLCVEGRHKCIEKFFEKSPNIESISILETYDPCNSQKGIFSSKKMITDLKSFPQTVSTLKLDPYLSSKDVRSCTFPKGIKKLIIVDQNLKMERTKKGILQGVEFKKKSDYIFDLSPIFKTCQEMEKLEIVAPKCLDPYSFACGIKLPSTLKCLTLAGTSILSGGITDIIESCPNIESLDVMWNEGISEFYSYAPLQNLQHLKTFTLSKEPTAELLDTLSKCPSLKTIVIAYRALTELWLSDKAKPLLDKLSELSIDPRDLREERIIMHLQKNYPHLNIVNNV